MRLENHIEAMTIGNRTASLKRAEYFCWMMSIVVKDFDALYIAA